MFFWFKRLFDFVLSFFFLIITFPLIVIFSLLIFLLDRNNPFFIQKRSGLKGKQIKIFKLQTMKTVDGIKIITNLGKFLRTSKIDELPQLINVLKNDMSLIGPRPLYLEFNNFYKNKHKLRIAIKPGLTGLAQVKVKDSTDWQKKFNFDVIYQKRANLNLECYIIFKTFLIIFNSIFFKEKRAVETIDYKDNFFNNYNK